MASLPQTIYQGKQRQVGTTDARLRNTTDKFTLSIEKHVELAALCSCDEREVWLLLFLSCSQVSEIIDPGSDDDTCFQQTPTFRTTGRPGGGGSATAVTYREGGLVRKDTHVRKRLQTQGDTPTQGPLKKLLSRTKGASPSFRPETFLYVVRKIPGNTLVASNSHVSWDCLHARFNAVDELYRSCA